MDEDFLIRSRVVIDEAKEALDNIQGLADKNEQLLVELGELIFKINYIDEKVQAYHIKADMLGIGLTVLGLVLALLAIIFMMNVTSTAKSEAREAANIEVKRFLDNTENMKEYVESWLDNNRTEIALAMYTASTRDASELGDEYAAAWQELGENEEHGVTNE